MDLRHIRECFLVVRMAPRGFMGDFLSRHDDDISPSQFRSHVTIKEGARTGSHHKGLRAVKSELYTETLNEVSMFRYNN